MIWQEVVFLVGGIAFAMALIPSVIGPMKPAPATSALSAGILLTYIVAFWTLGQEWSALGAAASAVLWIVLLVQAFARRPR